MTTIGTQAIREKYKNIIFNNILILFFLFLSGGCTAYISVKEYTNAHGHVIPKPIPMVTYSLTSTKSIQDQYGDNVLNFDHDMEDTIKDEPHYKHLSYINFRYSEPIDFNDYYIAIRKPHTIEKQLYSNSCWAASVQYLLYRESGKMYSQDSLILATQGENVDPRVEGAAIYEIMQTLGYVNLKMSGRSSRQIIAALSNNNPVIIGVYDEEKQTGHTMVVIGARYSFIPTLLTIIHGQYAYSEFQVFDPWDGKLKKIKAKDIEDNISFLLSFEKI